MTEIVKHDDGYGVVEQVVINGDLSKLDTAGRVQYYRRVCDSLGLNPYTRPFDYITLNGKLTLYAKKDATEQLRKIHGISITALDGELIDDLYIVSATAQARDGRIDQAKGAVSVAGLKGEAKANAIMKAETKAKRRVTLSIVGLGWTDETEIETIPGAQPVAIDMETGEIMAPERQVVNTELEALGVELYGDKWPEMLFRKCRALNVAEAALDADQIQDMIGGLRKLKAQRVAA